MKKYIIIGAGPAGLTAAYELLKKGEKDVVILEESSEIGGISRTVRYNGNRMDIGGHRFFSKNEEIMNFWASLMPFQSEPALDDKILERESDLDPNGADPEKVDEVWLKRTRISRIYYLKKFFDYPVSLKMQTLVNMGLWRTIKAGFSYLKTIFHKLPEDNLENFYINRFGKVLYSMFFEKYTEKLWGRHPSQIDASWGAQRVKGLSVRAVLANAITKPFKKKAEVETSLIEQFWYPKLGPGQLWEFLAKKVIDMGGKIQFNTAATSVETDGNKVVGVNGMSADVVISSMPLKDLVLSIDKKPDDIEKIAQGLPYRDYITTGILVPKLNLKNKTKRPTLGNIVPDCWIYIQESDVVIGRMQIYNNWSPYLVKNPKETVWVGLEYFCSEGDELWQMEKEQFLALAESELVKMGIIDEGIIMDYHVEKVKKAYPAYFDTYDKIDDVISFVNDYENLYCVGRNGQHRYNNMDHSMLTSIEAVKVILGENKNKEIIWNVNTEKDYHEAGDKKEE